MRQELLTWSDVDKLIDHLLPQFDIEFNAMVLITRGGVIPGGMLADALNIAAILTASVDFPAEMETEKNTSTRFMVWPKFIQFPDNNQLSGKSVLVVDDVWGSGRTITAVKNRVTSANGMPYTCVLHFNPYRSMFGTLRPNYFAAITDAYIVYPWEIDRGTNKIFLQNQ